METATLTKMAKQQYRAPTTSIKGEVMEQLRPRIKRLYDTGIGRFFEGISRIDEYAIEMDDGLMEKIKSKQFKRVVFVGYGGSLASPALLRDFFQYEGIPTEIILASEYSFEAPKWRNIIDSSVLVIVHSFSGGTKESLLALPKLKSMTDNLIVLTSGGNLLEPAKELGVSVVRWQLKDIDPEYPPYHITQLFSTLLDLFCKLEFIDSNYQRELAGVKLDSEAVNVKAKAIAAQLKDRPIRIVTTEEWAAVSYAGRLLLNEIAMVSTFSDDIGEFYHGSIAIFTEPVTDMGIILVRDTASDDFINERFDRLAEMFSRKQRVSYGEVELDQNNFLGKCLFGLLMFYYITYHVASYYNIAGQDIISSMTENPLYKG